MHVSPGPPLPPNSTGPTIHYPTPQKYKVVFKSSESEHMVWYKISFCDEDTHLSQAFAELQSISRCLSCWYGLVQFGLVGKLQRRELLRPTKQCKNAADGGPGVYGDGIFSRVIQGILISTRYIKTTSGKNAKLKKFNSALVYWSKCQDPFVAL